MEHCEKFVPSLPHKPFHFTTGPVSLENINLNLPGFLTQFGDAVSRVIQEAEQYVFSSRGP
jgi:hypothetical protein